MTFEQHLNNHPNKEEVEEYKKMKTIMRMITYRASEEKIDALIEKDFGTLEKATKRRQELEPKILAGWVPAGAEKRNDSRKSDSFEGLLAYATTTGGAIDTLKLQSQEGRYGSNGGRGCDVGVGGGPCSCGAWH